MDGTEWPSVKQTPIPEILVLDSQMRISPTRTALTDRHSGQHAYFRILRSLSLSALPNQVPPIFIGERRAEDERILPVRAGHFA